MKVPQFLRHVFMITLMTTTIIWCAEEESAFAVKSVEEFDTEVSNATKPLIVEFHSGCPVCLVTGAMIRDVVGTFGDQVKFMEVDINNLKELSDRYEITALPTVLLFAPGKTDIQYKISDPKREELESAIKKTTELAEYKKKFTLLGNSQLVILAVLIILGLFLVTLVRRKRK